MNSKPNTAINALRLIESALDTDACLITLIIYSFSARRSDHLCAERDSLPAFGRCNRRELSK